MRAARRSGLRVVEVDPAQVSLAVELRQRIEECASCRRVSREHDGDIVGEIPALRSFRGQLDTDLSCANHQNPAVLISRFGARVSIHHRRPEPAWCETGSRQLCRLTG